MHGTIKMMILRETTEATKSEYMVNAEYKVGRDLFLV